MLPVLYAFSANTAMKLAMAMITGGREFALPVGIGLLFVLASAWAVWLLG